MLENELHNRRTRLSYLQTQPKESSTVAREEDKLINYIMKNGQGCWSDVAKQDGSYTTTSRTLISFNQILDKFKPFKGARGSFISWGTRDYPP